MNNFLVKNTLKILISILITCLIISCENRGCIEADDFGEYNSYNLEVYANNFYNLCKYDPTKTYNDNSQGICLENILMQIVQAH